MVARHEQIVREMISQLKASLEHGSPHQEWRPGMPRLFDHLAVTSRPISFSSITSKEQLSQFIENLFRKYGVCKLNFIKDKLNEHQAQAISVGLIEHVDPISDTIFNETLAAIGLNITTDLYCRKSTNPQFDPYRHVIVGLFSSQKEVKKADVMTACFNRLSYGLYDSQFSKIIKEFAITNKRGVWALKTGQYQS